MKTIHMHSLLPNGTTTVSLPRNAQVLSVAAQGSIPYLYSLASATETQFEMREFIIYMTGWIIPDSVQVFNGKYYDNGTPMVVQRTPHFIGTAVTSDETVLHVFELKGHA